MYKVMLVEDDSAVCYVYSKMRSWGKHGFQIAAEATNGVRALETLKKQPVDVIFTDIRMPLMDGIELMRQADQLQLRARFVIISSYNEFEYAREGMRMGALDYVVKPMGEENLDEVLSRVEKQLQIQGVQSEAIDLSRVLVEQGYREDTFVKQLLTYLGEHLSERPSLEQLSEVFSMNRDYFGRQIRRKTGLPYRSLCHRLKAEYAKVMLKSGQYRIYEISDQLGYTSADYFTQAFKQVTGMSPAEYKKSDL